MKKETKLDFEEYTALSGRTRANLSNEFLDNMHMILGMITELGELADVYKKYLAYDKDIDRINVQEELGDIMWYIAGFCETNNFDMDRILKTNLLKLNQRYPNAFTKEDAIIRNLEKERRILEELGY